jgi:hypothetical protein
MVVMPDISASSICCGQDPAFAGNRLRARSDEDVDPRLGVRVTGLADGGDAAVLQPDIGLVDAGRIEDERIGDDGVHRAFAACGLALPHTVADDLAAAELDLLAINGEVLFNLDEKLGIGKPDAVAHSRTVHLGIGRAGQCCHQSSPITLPLKP